MVDWKRYEKDMHSADPEIADKAQEAFTEVRASNTAGSIDARKFEEARVKEWQANKPLHVKQRLARDARKDPSIRTLEKIKDAGMFDTGVIPSPGLILVEMDPVEQKQANGFVLPQSNDDLPNTATVIEVGDNLVLESGSVIKFPHKAGDHVIIRKGSPNLNVKLQGKSYYFLQFNDVLARFKE